jgi:hypothetical protein
VKVRFKTKGITGRENRERQKSTPQEPIGVPAANGGKGASGRVPAAKAERPLSVQSTDLRGDVGQRARRADSGRSQDRDPAAGFDPELPFKTERWVAARNLR